METAEEDLPHAFRGMPCAPCDLAANIIGVPQPETQMLQLQQMWAILLDTLRIPSKLADTAAGSRLC